MLNVAYRLLPFLLIGLSVVSALGGCAAQQTTTNTPQAAFILPAVLNPEDFSKEIARLEAILKKEKDPSVIAKTHLQLALLYSHYKNPNRDYLKALQELEAYISIYPEGKTDEIQNLLTMLREFKKMALENKQLLNEGHEAGIKMEELIQQNNELKRVVEELEHLDIKIEEKRKQIKE